MKLYLRSRVELVINYRLASQRLNAKNAALMPFDKFVDAETLNQERRKAITKSIRTISVDELKKLAEEVFHDIDEPWRHTFFRSIAENPGGTFHHAATSEGVVFLYYRAEDKGLWFSARRWQGANERKRTTDDEGSSRRRPFDGLTSYIRVAGIGLIAVKTVDHVSDGCEAVYASRFAVDAFLAQSVAHRGTRFDRLKSGSPLRC